MSRILPKQRRPDPEVVWVGALSHQDAPGTKDPPTLVENLGQQSAGEMLEEVEGRYRTDRPTITGLQSIENIGMVYFDIEGKDFECHKFYDTIDTVERVSHG